MDERWLEAGLWRAHWSVLAGEGQGTLPGMFALPRSTPQHPGAASPLAPPAGGLAVCTVPPAGWVGGGLWVGEGMIGVLGAGWGFRSICGVRFWSLALHQVPYESPLASLLRRERETKSILTEGGPSSS